MITLTVKLKSDISPYNFFGATECYFIYHEAFGNSLHLKDSPEDKMCILFSPCMSVTYPEIANRCQNISLLFSNFTARRNVKLYFNVPPRCFNSIERGAGGVVYLQLQ